MTRTSVGPVCGVVLSVLMWANPVVAAGPGTVNGKVTDPEGNPLDDVEVSALAEGSSLPGVVHTNKKGKFGIRVPDRALIYEITFSLDGYEDVVARIRPKMEGLTYVEVVMSPVQAPVVTGDSPQPTPPPPIGEEISEQRQAAISVFNDGVTSLNEEDLATATARFREASDIDPEWAEPYRALAAVGMEAKDYATAAKAANALLQREPDNVQGLRTAYFANYMIDDMGAFIAAAQRLVELNPPMVEGEMLDNARTMFESNSISFARGLLEVIIGARPELADAHYLLGLCCNAQADETCVVGAFNRFIDLAPDSPDAPTAQAMIDYYR